MHSLADKYLVHLSKGFSKKYFQAGFVSFQAFCCGDCCIGRTLISSSNCNKVNEAKLISCLAQIHKHKCTTRYTNRYTNRLTMTKLVQKVYLPPKVRGWRHWLYPACMKCWQQVNNILACLQFDVFDVFVLKLLYTYV